MRNRIGDEGADRRASHGLTDRGPHPPLAALTGSSSECLFRLKPGIPHPARHLFIASKPSLQMPRVASAGIPACAAQDRRPAGARFGPQCPASLTVWRQADRQENAGPDMDRHQIESSRVQPARHRHRPDGPASPCGRKIEDWRDATASMSRLISIPTPRRIKRREKLQKPPRAGFPHQALPETAFRRRPSAARFPRQFRKHAACGFHPASGIGAEIGRRLFHWRLDLTCESRSISRSIKASALSSRAKPTGNLTADRIVGQSEIGPGPFLITIDQIRFRQKLQMAGNTRLRLAENDGEIRNRQVSTGQKRKDARRRLGSATALSTSTIRSSCNRNPVISLPLNI